MDVRAFGLWMSTPKSLFFHHFEGLTEAFAPRRPPGYPRGRPRGIRPQNSLFGPIFRSWKKATAQFRSISGSFAANPHSPRIWPWQSQRARRSKKFILARTHEKKKKKHSLTHEIFILAWNVHSRFEKFILAWKFQSRALFFCGQRGARNEKTILDWKFHSVLKAWFFQYGLSRLIFFNPGALWDVLLRECENTLYPLHGQNRNHVVLVFGLSISLFLPVSKEKVVLVSEKVVLVFGFSFA